jgi:hypothetical protein
MLGEFVEFCMHPELRKGVTQNVNVIADEVMVFSGVISFME